MRNAKSNHLFKKRAQSKKYANIKRVNQISIQQNMDMKAQANLEAERLDNERKRMMVLVRRGSYATDRNTWTISDRSPNSFAAVQ